MKDKRVIEDFIHFYILFMFLQNDPLVMPLDFFIRQQYILVIYES
jgi:hypothetical protein